MSYINQTDYLYHHGIKGMKWGVRRYQNYDGSYTKAGIKRFNDSLDKYEKANSRYKSAKKDGTSKTEITNARLNRKKTKQRLNKDYKHLSQDKLADKGKELYAKGKTITGNNAVNHYLSGIGGLSISAAGFNHKLGGPRLATQILAASGLGTIGIATIKSFKDYDDAKKLRAYYSHTSNY